MPQGADDSGNPGSTSGAELNQSESRLEIAPRTIGLNEILTTLDNGLILNFCDIIYDWNRLLYVHIVVALNCINDIKSNMRKTPTIKVNVSFPNTTVYNHHIKLRLFHNLSLI